VPAATEISSPRPRVMNSCPRFCHPGDEHLAGQAYHIAPRSVCGSDHIQNGIRPSLFCTRPKVYFLLGAPHVRLRQKRPSLSRSNIGTSTAPSESLPIVGFGPRLCDNPLSTGGVEAQPPGFAARFGCQRTTRKRRGADTVARSGCGCCEDGKRHGSRHTVSQVVGKRSRTVFQPAGQSLPLDYRLSVAGWRSRPAPPRRVPVRTENLNPSVAVMKSAQEGV
jgi:hypothetical protein